MDTKLTLKIDKQIINRAKKYALEHKTSLSQIVEDYFDIIVKPTESDSELTPLVKKLSGVAKLPESYNSRKEYTKYLIRKYR
jgi:hypothetical protein